MLAEVATLDDVRIAARNDSELPTYIHRAMAGFEVHYYYFEVLEMVRKLALIGISVAFEPGSLVQSVYGLMVSFLCFGLFAGLSPYVDPAEDRLAMLCQMLIFVVLLSAIVLRSDASEVATVGLDILLLALTIVPIVLSVALEIPYAFYIFVYNCLGKLVWSIGGQKLAKMLSVSKGASGAATVDASKTTVASPPAAPSSGKLLRSLTQRIPAALLTHGEDQDDEDQDDEDHTLDGLAPRHKRPDLSERSHRKHSVFVPSRPTDVDEEARLSRLAEAFEKAQARGSRGSASTRRLVTKSFREVQEHSKRSGSVEAPPRITSRQRQSRGGTSLPAPARLPRASMNISI